MKALVTPLVCILLLAAPSFAQPPEKEIGAKVVNMVRLINTMEMAHSAQNHRYATAAELKLYIESGARKEYTQEAQRKELTSGFIADPAQPLAGYELRIVLTAEAKGYVLTLRPSQGCGFSAFSDERGLIYRANALGCEKEQAEAAK